MLNVLVLLPALVCVPLLVQVTEWFVTTEPVVTLQVASALNAVPSYVLLWSVAVTVIAFLVILQLKVLAA